MPHKLSFSLELVVLINTWGKSMSKMPSSNMSRRGWAEPLLFLKDDSAKTQEIHTYKFKKEYRLLFSCCYADWFAGYTSQIFLSHWYQLSSNHVNKNRYVEICHWGIPKQPANVKLHTNTTEKTQDSTGWLTDYTVIFWPWVFVTWVEL